MIDANRICIVRLGGFGDVINTMPALDAVRNAAPDAHLAWLVETVWKDVLPGPPRLNEVVAMPKREWISQLKEMTGVLALPGGLAEFVKKLRAHKFDLAIDLHGNLRSGLACRATGAPVRAGFAPGFCKEGNHLFTNRHYPVGEGRVHRIDRALALVEQLGAPAVTDRPRIDVADCRLAFAREVFARHGLSTHPVVAVHPGTSDFGEYKRWPVERFRRVAGRLIERGYRVLVTWGPGERGLAERAAAGTEAVISPETASVADLAGLLSMCDAFIGADSGPAVLAAAVDTPPVVIFGPKDPAVYAPRHPRTKVVEVEMACRPCSRRWCDDPRCMLDITLDRVMAAVDALLEEMEGN